MRIPSRQVPQADRLHVVVQVVEAVGSGAQTYQQIARFIDKVERQGRYYRLAAELLGFIRKVGSNRVSLTTRGYDLLSTQGEDRNRILRSAVAQIEVFERVLQLLDERPRGVTREELVAFIETIVSPVGPTMMKRRVATIMEWLNDLGMIEERSGKIFNKKL